MKTIAIILLTMLAVGCYPSKRAHFREFDKCYDKDSTIQVPCKMTWNLAR